MSEKNAKNAKNAIEAKAADLLRPSTPLNQTQDGLEELGRSVARAALDKAERRRMQSDARLLLTRLAF